MLINSNTMRGKCPVCGAPDCACGGPSTTNGVIITEAETYAGPLVTLDLGRGRGMKVPESAAKAMPAARNKARRMANNKGRHDG